LNIAASSGNFPKELKEGIIIPIHKAGKKKGVLENLRPIILLSMLRIITARIILKRIYNRIDREIDSNQAAYRKGRSATELIFAIRILAEKAITSSEYEINVLLLDMSKAFDSVNRNILLSDLGTVLEKDELHRLWYKYF